MIIMLMTAIVLFALGLAGIATQRHFIVVMLAVELILLASTIVLVYIFSYTPSPSPDGTVALISIWAVATVEIITVIAFYSYMKRGGYAFDISALSKMKW